MEPKQLAASALVFGLIAILMALLSIPLFRMPPYSWERPALGQKVPFGWVALLVALILFQVAYTIAALLIASVNTRYPPSFGQALFSRQVWSIFSLAVVLLIVYIAFTLLVQWRVRTPLFRWFWAEGPVGRSIGIGFGTYPVAFSSASAIGLAVAAIVTSIVGPFPLQQAPVQVVRSFVSYPQYYWIAGATIALIIPFVEEIVFRGFVHSALRRYMSRHAALPLSAAIFALHHYSHTQGWANFSVCSVIFVLGWFLGYIYERQRTLWAPYCLHALFNGMTVVGIFFMNKLSFS